MSCRRCTGNLFHTHGLAAVKLRSPKLLWVRVHQSQTFPVDVIYCQLLNITWTYHVSSSALSVVGPSLSQVRRSGTHYTIRHYNRPSNSFNRWRRTYFVVTTQHTQHSRDVSWLCYINLLLTLTLWCHGVVWIHSKTSTKLWSKKELVTSISVSPF